MTCYTLQVTCYNYSMLTIICGEDNVASRKYFQDIKETFSKKNFEIKNIASNEISELKKWLIESPTLFSSSRAFFVENLMKYLKKFKTKDHIKELEDIARMRDVELFDWENGLTSRDLKKIAGAVIKEFKPSENIFKLLDACFPTNKTRFINILNRVEENADENFIFTMLTRHIRNLIIIKENITPPKMQSWQASKLKLQTKFWQLNKLISFYDSLFRIEIRNKTGANPYNIKESLDILATLFL